MIDPISASMMGDALAGITSQMQGLTLDQAYDQFMDNQFETDNGPPIGYSNWTSDTPAISGDTSGSISTGTPGVTPVDAWNDYVENDPTPVSDTTGAIVSGSNAVTVPYSIVGGPGAMDLQAVCPVGVPVEAAVVAMAQAAGVSIDAANLDVETKQTLVNSYMAVSGVIYDKAKGLVTAWKDKLGNILFPKKAFEAIYNTLEELGIGPGDDNFPGYSTSGTVTATGIDVMPYVLTGLNYTGEGEVAVTFNGSPPPGPSICWRYWKGDSSTLTGTYYVYYFTPGSQLTLGSRGRYNGTAEVRFLPPVASQQLPQRIEVTYNPNARGNTTDYLFVGQATFGGTFEQSSGLGVTPGGEFPEGTSQSQAPSYTPSTIPSAGNLATSYDPDTGILGTEPLVPINIPANPYDATDSTADPTDPTDDDNPAVALPGETITWTEDDPITGEPTDQEGQIPIPLPIPDTKPSNPDVPLVNPSVVDSTLIDELVDELADTLDPQPPQSSGIIPIPGLPGITDPDTGQTTFPSIIPDSSPGFIHVYNPTPQEFVSFGSWLWVTYADATIEKILNNPFDGVIGAHELYATPNRGGRDNIRSAFLVCPTSADLVPNRYTEIDCGTVIVPEFYGNYLDYSPYSQAYIYLPFIGINEVSIDDIVGHAVNIRYRVDSYSGACIAMIFVAKNGYQNLCYQFGGNCAVEVPMAGGSQAAIKAGMIQAEAYAQAAMVSAAGNLASGIGSALSGNIGGAVSNLAGIASTYANAKAGVEAARVANKSSVQHSGQFGASHGAMGQKIPFIIIRNPIQVKVVNYNDDYGFPAHKRVIIGGCSGYLRVREVNVISAHATDDEKAAIEAMLKNGVYVS